MLEYLDEDKKYTLDIYCKMAEKDSNVNAFEVGDTVSIIGTIGQFRIRDGIDPNIVNIRGCFAESNTAAEIIEIE